MIKVIDCYCDEQDVPVVRSECGNCQARLSVDESLFNSNVVCPSCEVEFSVPNYEVQKKDKATKKSTRKSMLSVNTSKLK